MLRRLSRIRAANLTIIIGVATLSCVFAGLAQGFLGVLVALLSSATILVATAWILYTDRLLPERLLVSFAFLVLTHGLSVAFLYNPLFSQGTKLWLFVVALAALIMYLAVDAWRYKWSGQKQPPSHSA